MDWWLLSFFIGAILSLFLPVVPALFYVIVILLISIALFYCKATRSSSGLWFGIVWMLFNGYIYDNVWNANNLDAEALARHDNVIVGTVVNLPTLKDQNYRFNFRISAINAQALVKPFNVRLNWNISEKYKPIALFSVAQGQELQLKVKFKPAHGFANPGGFNYQTWLRVQNIVATGYVKSSVDNKIINQPKAFYHLRQTLYQQYLQVLPSHALSPLLLALSFAERSQITTPLWDVLQATGTQHLIAISGLHLGLVATGSYFCLFLLLSKLPVSRLFAESFQQRLMLSNSKLIVIVMSLLITTFYGYLADFSIPTVRALLMLLLYWSVRLLGFKLSLVRGMLIMLFALLLHPPLSLLSVSFWLSIYAVVIIFLTLWRFSSLLNQGSAIWRFFKGLVLIQLCLTVFLLPITALFTQEISLISFAANIIAVPVMSFLLIPLCLLALCFLPLSDFLAVKVIEITLYFLSYLWHYLSWLSAPDFVLVTLSSKQINWLSVLMVGLALLCFMPNSLSVISKICKHVKITGREFSIKVSNVEPRLKAFIISKLALRIWHFIVLSSCVLITIYGWEQYQKNTNTLVGNEAQNLSWQVSVLDVGQGLSVVIEKNNRAILYDTGAAYPSGFNLVESAVLPYLKYQGITLLDKVIISHSDNDHAGGLPILQKQIAIEPFMINDAEIEVPESKREPCLNGQSFKWQGLTFKQLWPLSQVGQENDDSCVIQISDATFKVLLTGDI